MADKGPQDPSDEVKEHCTVMKNIKDQFDHDLNTAIEKRDSKLELVELQHEANIKDIDEYYEIKRQKIMDAIKADVEKQIKLLQEEYKKVLLESRGHVVNKPKTMKSMKIKRH